MYKSPIELIYESIQSQLDECIYKEIQKVDIKVDKEELLKALAYDREQYKKGYEDAQAEQQEHGQWIEKQVGNASLVDDGYKHINRVCLYCGAVQPVTEPRDNIICHYCGAMLDEEEKDNDGRNRN